MEDKDNLKIIVKLDPVIQLGTVLLSSWSVSFSGGKQTQTSIILGKC